MIKDINELLSFCFSSFWVWLGLTIWLLILTGYFKKTIIPKTKERWEKFKKLFKDAFRKEITPKVEIKK